MVNSIIYSTQFDQPRTSIHNTHFASAKKILTSINFTFK